MGSGRVTPELVTLRLQEAGATELLLVVRDLRPAGFRSAMPEVIREAEDLRYAAPRVMRPVPSPAAIGQWEEARGWIARALPGVGQTATRRVLGYRMLTYWIGHPHAGRSLYSWRRLGTLLRMDDKTAKARWEMGVGRIVTMLNWDARPAGAGLCAVFKPGRGAAATMVGRCRRELV